MFHSWDPHFVTETNPFCYKTVVFEMPGAQLRIRGWPIPVTLLSLNSINPPPLHSFVFWKFVEAVPLPTNAVTTNCNATSRHGLEIMEESGFHYYNNNYLSGFHSIYNALCKPDPTVTFLICLLEKNHKHLSVPFSEIIS